MLPDTGERYLSTPLFEGIGTEMSDDEVEISRSTPGCQFGEPAPAPSCGIRPRRPASEPAVAAVAEPAVAELAAWATADDFVARVLANSQQPLVLFALEWCEFCWSLRKLFAACAIPYRAVDLDSTSYRQDDRGGQIRAVLHARTGSRTIPQVFVGTEHIGGCTETMDAFKEGRLQRLLESRGVRFDDSVRLDPYTLLPTWLHPR